MTGQLDLGIALREAPYQRKSPTSRRQAERIRPKAGTQRARVLSYLEARSATMHEVADALRIPLSSVCARMSELREAGLAAATDETRETEFGGSAAVWKVL